MQQIKKKQKSSMRGPVFAFLFPAGSLLLLVAGIPLAHSLWLSFQRWNLISDPTFIGFENYTRILRDKSFYQAIGVTLTYSAISIVLQMSIAFFIAQLLNNRYVRWRSFWHSILVLPMMITPVVIASMWRAYLNREFGIVNVLFSLVGLPIRAWAMESSTALATVIIIEVWHKTSFLILILSAGVANLRKDILEAAVIDGAGYWQRTIRMQIPMLGPVIRTGALFQIVDLLRVFDKIYILTEGGPGRTTTTLSLAVFQRTFQAWQVGRGAAMSYLVMILTGIITSTLLIGLKQEGDL